MFDPSGPFDMKRKFNEQGEVIEEKPFKILDVAGGTGDISFLMLQKSRRDHQGSIKLLNNNFRQDC